MHDVAAHVAEKRYGKTKTYFVTVKEPPRGEKEPTTQLCCDHPGVEPAIKLHERGTGVDCSTLLHVASEEVTTLAPVGVQTVFCHTAGLLVG